MSNLQTKIEEIKNSNISEEEKIIKIRELIDEKNLTKRKINKSDVYDLNFLFLFILAFVSIPYINIRMDSKTSETLLMSILTGIVLFILIPLIIKRIRRDKYWKNMMREEAESFQMVCDDLCSSFMNELKRKRNLIIFCGIMYGIGLMSFWLLIPVILFNSKSQNTFGILLIFYTILSIGGFLFLKNLKEKYKELYKEEVITNFIKQFNNNLEYNKAEINAYTLESDYKYTRLDEEANGYSWYLKIEDCITGYIDEKAHIKMADVTSYQKHRNDYNILFKGNFTTININKTFEECKIIRNKINILDRNELINTDNKQFNKYFEIHAQNKEEVQSYLTPSVIQFIADFREKYQIDFEIVFKDKIYIRFYTKNMFEPKMIGNIVDKYSVYQIYVITKFVKELVDKVNN